MCVMPQWVFAVIVKCAEGCQSLQYDWLSRGYVGAYVTMEAVIRNAPRHHLDNDGMHRLT